ncbi:glutamine--fructose-6-phosphate transaminase (isomerizing) [Candidatus Micrarchaeota archaeon]|nr:glutamine--fructose-6-phosphate transaminase (isomerizing) [Candidatus Micrarchaeota archaeon]MBU1681195.1 glutamine--fructose-6-phosphate transaminase (isomerizing) [Candidatus Micrarchaeota archaeon]
MCGIIGYIGSNVASQILTEGLKRLEYRGYDSVGIAVLDNSSLEIRKDIGMVDEVSTALQFTNVNGHIGLGHTRWATHGSVCRENSHPHFDSSKKIVAAHNGVIENFSKLRDDLLSKGHKFVSDTDSELIPHLIEEHAKDSNLLKAFIKSVLEIQGSYAIVALSSADSEERLFLARKNSPLIIGVGQGEMFCASDISAMLKHTKTFVPLEEGDIAILTKTGYKVYSVDGSEVQRKQITVDWNEDIAQKGGYSHFMLKEIHDQKHFINESLATDVTEAKKLIGEYEKIHVLGCGTSYHAGLILAHLLPDKNIHAFIASDYPFVAKPDEKTLIIAISQSGETADILQALRFAKNSSKIAITNTVESTITRICDITVYLNSGPEIGVAATKTFTSQLAVIFKLAREKPVGLSAIIEKMIEKENEIKAIAAKLAGSEHAFFLARGLNVPIANEGSLKFKEITYIHSEAYPGGELKHGTLSLITDGTPIIALAPKDETVIKLLGNIKEAKARGGLIISLTNDDNVKEESDFVIGLPDIEVSLYPFALIVPLQLLAYHVSVLRGINPDRPRNLAKSVTVE